MRDKKHEKLALSDRFSMLPIFSLPCTVLVRSIIMYWDFVYVIQTEPNFHHLFIIACFGGKARKAEAECEYLDKIIR